MSDKVNQTTEYFDNLNNTSSKLVDVVQNINSIGDFQEIYDADVILNSIMNTLNIVKGTYIFDPNFGVGLYKYLFELATTQTRDKILSEIRSQISKYEQRANIDINIKFLNDKKGFNINITVSLNGMKRSGTIQINESTLKGIK